MGNDQSHFQGPPPMTFVPPLQSTTRVSTPPAAEANVVRVILRARVSAEDFAERVKRDGARIQAWTVTRTDGQDAGPWGAQDFEEARIDETPLEHDGTSLRLSSAEDLTPAVHREGGKELRATFLLPNTARTTFHFTYRLVYPSGNVHWFGNDSDNGCLEIVPGGGFFTEVGSWSEKDSGLRTLASDASNVGDIVVGKVDVEHYDWTCWAVFGTSVSRFILPSSSQISRASMLVLIPHFPPDAVLAPQPTVFHATSDSSPISMSSTGTVVFHSSGNGTLERGVYTPDPTHDLSLLHAQLSTSCSKPKILSNSTETLVLSPHHEPDVSSTIYLLPLSAEMPPGGWRVALPLESLSQFVPDSSCVSFFCRETLNSVFVDLFETQSTDLVLSVGKNGGELVISPIYNINSAQLAFPSILSIPEVVQPTMPPPMPTPPASPPVETRKLRSVDLSLEERPTTTVKEARTAVEQPAIPGADADDEAFEPTAADNIHHPPPGSALALRRRMDLSPNLRRFLDEWRLTPYLLSAFTVATMLLGMLFQHLLRPLSGSSTETAQAIGRSKGSSKNSSREDGQTTSIDGREGIGLSEPGGANSPSAKHESDEPSTSSVTCGDVDETNGTSGPLHQRPGVEASAPASRVFEVTLTSGSEEPSPVIRFDIPQPAVKLAFLMRTDITGPDLKHLQVRVDGRDVSPSVRDLGNRTTLFEVEYD